jgi:hypothetical protein
MGVTDKVWDALTTVIKRSCKSVCKSSSTTATPGVGASPLARTRFVIRL